MPAICDNNYCPQSGDVARVFVTRDDGVEREITCEDWSFNVSGPIHESHTPRYKRFRFPGADDIVGGQMLMTWDKCNPPDDKTAASLRRGSVHLGRFYVDENDDGTPGRYWEFRFIIDSIGVGGQFDQKEGYVITFSLGCGGVKYPTDPAS